MARAKNLLLLAVIMTALPACTMARRLAPPGFFKYEEIAGDQPQNPAIRARIDERRAAGNGRFPVLSQTPDEKPQLAPPAERRRQQDQLRRDGEALSAAADSDLAAAARTSDQDGAGLLTGELERLDAAFDALRRQAARDRLSKPDEDIE